MKISIIISTLFFSFAAYSHPTGHEHKDAAIKTSSASSEAHIIDQKNVKKFTNNGNTIMALATKKNGAKSHEVWRTSIAAGGQTPLHVHNSEETFVVLKGEGIVVIGDKEYPFKAPCTVIAPAGVPHQLKNTGKIPTDQIVIISIDSKIKNPKGSVMNLPWRK